MKHNLALTHDDAADLEPLTNAVDRVVAGIARTAADQRRPGSGYLVNPPLTTREREWADRARLAARLLEVLANTHGDDVLSPSLDPALIALRAILADADRAPSPAANPLSSGATPMVTITVDVRTHRLIEHAMRAFAPESISRLPSHFQVKIGDDRFSGADLTDAYNAVAAAPRSGVRAFLDLSTSHLQASTREMWTESFDAEHFPTPAWCGETGWLLFVPASNDAWDHVCGPELPAIFDHARAAGAEYVRFDEGAPVIEALPIFEDAEEPEADAFWTAAMAAEAEPAAPFTFTPDDDAFIQAMSVQSFDATQIARLLGNRTGMPCSRTDVAVRLADLATAEALHG